MAYGHPNTRRTVYVAFQDSDHGAPWQLFTSPGFQHCWAFWPVYYPEESLLAHRFTVKFEPLRWGIHCDVWFADPAEVIAEFAQAPTACIIATEVDLPPKNFSYMFPIRGALTCVSAVKAVLGMRNWRIVTPRQLAKCLLADGGRLIYPGAEHGSSDFLNLRRR